MASDDPGSGRPDKPARSSGSRRPEPNPLVLLGAATELGLITAMMTGLGYWLDRQFDTLPWLMVSGAVVGIVAGFYNLWRVARRFFD